MNLIQLPIPDQYIYIDTDKIISMTFDAYTGKLTIELLDDSIKTFSNGAKRILDKILEVTECKDGIPKIKRITDIPVAVDPKLALDVNFNEVGAICDLIT